MSSTREEPHYLVLLGPSLSWDWNLVGRSYAACAGLFPAEAVARARNGAGVIRGLAVDQAEQLIARLAESGISSFAVPASHWPITPRLRNVQRSLVSDIGLWVEVSGLSEGFVISWPKLRFLSLRAVKEHRFAPDRGTTGVEPRHLTGAELRLLDAIASVEKTQKVSLGFSLDILAWDPVWALVLDRRRLVFADADQCGEHGLINFVRLAQKIIDRAPARSTVPSTRRFLRDLDLEKILDPDNGMRRGLLHWAHAEMLHAEIG